MAKYIAAGFFNDAEKLLDEFVAGNSYDFFVFAQLWKKHNFAAVFVGRDDQITLFTNEIFQITLGFLQNAAFTYQVGAIYLLYALFRHQISSPLILIRITLSQFQIFRNAQASAMINHFNTLRYVTDYLCQNSFDFVALPTLLGPRFPKVKPDYQKPTFVSSSLLKEMKTEMVQFNASRVLENLRDMSRDYSNLRDKVYPQEVQNTFQQYDKYIEQLDNLINDRPMHFSKDKWTSSQTESAIGSRRAEIKAAAFSKKACFHQLNESDKDCGTVEDIKPEVKEFCKRRRLRKGKRKIGRPKKETLEDLLMNSDKVDKNSASETESPVKVEERRGRRRMTFLDEFNVVSALSPIKLKQESAYTTFSDPEEETSFHEETDDESYNSETSEN